MTWRVILSPVLAALAFAGCNAAPSSPVVDRATSLVLEAAPALVSVDRQAGPGGVQVRVRFYVVDSAGRTTTAGVTGSLDMILFGEPVRPEAVATAAPFHVWRLSQADLAKLLRQDGLKLWCYQFALTWGTQGPTGSEVCLVAKYNPPSGAPMYSAPTSITLRAQ